MKRLRIVGYMVQPQLVLDDGEQLEPLPVQPVTIPPAEWPNVVEKIASDLEALKSQVEEE